MYKELVCETTCLNAYIAYYFRISIRFLDKLILSSLESFQVQRMNLINPKYLFNYS